ncbi:MAG: branched-chain amino acid ABC transporter permease [Alphaproteobacteria bacterium]|nr:branched-chain amino acid ABC transporter permease [Alphaproteobacteria bacterium]
MDVFVQHVVNGLALGGVYALLSLGLALVFSILGLINFAHGELLTLGGYAIYGGLAVLALPFGGAVVVAIIATAVAAMAMERVAFRPVRDASAASMLLTSFAVSALLQVVLQNAISPRGKAIVTPAFFKQAITISDLVVGSIQALSIVATAILLLLLMVFLRSTVLGLAMRAAAVDFRTTRLMGIHANAVVATAFALSGILAGVAALLWVAQSGSVRPLMGLVPVLKAFIAVILGGLGSLPGAVVGGFVLGFIEVFLRAYLPGAALEFREAIALLIVITILFFRPQGLLGRRVEAAR